MSNDDDWAAKHLESRGYTSSDSGDRGGGGFPLPAFVLGIALALILAGFFGVFDHLTIHSSNDAYWSRP